MKGILYPVEDMAKLFVFILSILLTINCFSQDQLIFRHLGVKDGLSNNNVLCVLQDQKGFLWFGTANGLNRYDGYSFKTYSNNENGLLSLSDNFIRALAIDHIGRIWIGTNNGLNCLDPVTDTFHHFLNNQADSTSLSSNRITALHFSKSNILWIGTDSGLNRFNTESIENVQLKNSLRTKTNSIANEVNSITEDADGFIWVGLWWGGLKEINPETLDVTSFFPNSTNNYGLSNDNVLATFCDKSNYIWIANYMGGICKIDPETDTFLPLAKSANLIDLGTMEQDLSGNLWIKNNPGSLLIIDPKNQQKTLLANNPGNPTSITTGLISDIFCDKSGVIWLATDKGITYYDSRSQLFSKYYHQLDIGMRDYCNSFYQDADDMVWIVIYDLGVVKYDPKNKKVSGILTQDIADPNSINHKTVNGIAADREGNIWLATNNGMCVVESKTCRVINRLFYNNEDDPAILNGIMARTTGRQSQYFWGVEGGILDIKNQKKWLLSEDGRISINDLKIKCITKDSKGDFWIGTEFLGLKHFKIPSGQITDYFHNPEDSTTICSNTINDIFESQNGNFWISTPNGLSRFDPENEIFTHFTKKDGLSATECFGAKEDTKGNIWILNSNGLDKYNTKTGSVVKYDADDGLLLNQNGLYQNEAGYIFSGHIENGFYYFHPDSISETNSNQNVVLTDFFIFNEPVSVSNTKEKTVLSKTIQYTNEIVLNHNQNVFGFEFSMLNYSKNGKSRYAYKLDGFDEIWLVSDEKNRRVTYSNLDPGKYVFRVKVATGTAQKNTPETAVKITILAPLWATKWAYSLYFIAFISLLFFIWKYFADRKKLILSYSEHFNNTSSQGTFELAPSQPFLPDTEKIFMDRLMSIIEQNISEVDFDVSQFASAAGMESSVLHRKLKAIINQSPGEFIRSMRMKRAAQLLSDKSITITEVADKVGFANNTNYFSTAFRKHFGKTPKEFQHS